MDIVPYEGATTLEANLAAISTPLKEWQKNTLQVSEDSDEEFTAATFAETLRSLLRYEKGSIFVLNDRKLILLLRCGPNSTPIDVTRKLETQLPGSRFDVSVGESSAEGLVNLETQVTWKKLEIVSMPTETRGQRQEQVILIADDDMYVRTLVKKGLDRSIRIEEVIDGKQVLENYRKFMPDILFLDIHLPGRNGKQILSDVLEAYPRAYIIMLSADSSLENVKLALQQGAKGFLTKPFTKDRLLEYVHQCPTIRH